MIFLKSIEDDLKNRKGGENSPSFLAMIFVVDVTIEDRIAG